PLVSLSSSFDFFSQISFDMLAASFVHDAEITISNGTLTHKLKEYEIPLAGDYKLYYYSIDSADMATAFKGEFGGAYTMTIKSGGKDYNAATTIPYLVKRIESLSWETVKNQPDSGLVILYGETTDPPGLGNYIRYFTSTNDGPYFPGLNSVFDDQIVDGTHYQVQIEKGVNRNETIDFDDYSFFHRGDSVTVKMTNIDKANFDFWRTIEYSYQSIGNPFSSPTKVLGNISNGALGYFGGYAVQYKGYKIPD
ncbi:MAG: DUF4249 family protein, partial [Chitinophagaceae bacterium]